MTLCSIVMACDKQPQKTESMLRFERTQQQQKVLVEKATLVLNRDVLEDPISNLSDLLFAKELSIQAADVYRQANVVGIAQPNLVELEQRIIAFYPSLAEHAVSLLSEVADKSISLKEQLYDLKSQSYAANQRQGGADVATYLGSKYNQDIKTCCLDTLASIRFLLKQNKQSNYIRLDKLIKNVVSDQEEILYQEGKVNMYKEQLAELQGSFIHQ